MLLARATTGSGRAARRVDSCLAVPHAQLRVDVLQVLADGSDAQGQTVGGLLVGEASRDQAEDLRLPGGEPGLARELVGAVPPAQRRGLQRRRDPQRRYLSWS